MQPIHLMRLSHAMRVDKSVIIIATRRCERYCMQLMHFSIINADTTDAQDKSRYHLVLRPRAMRRSRSRHLYPQRRRILHRRWRRSPRRIRSTRKTRRKSMPRTRHLPRMNNNRASFEPGGLKFQGSNIRDVLKGPFCPGQPGKPIRFWYVIRHIGYPPSPAISEACWTKLDLLHELGPIGSVFLISGNHFNPAMHAIPSV